MSLSSWEILGAEVARNIGGNTGDLETVCFTIASAISYGCALVGIEDEDYDKLLDLLRRDMND